MPSIILPYTNLGETLGVSLDFAKIPHRQLAEHSFLVDASKVGDDISIGIDVQVPSTILRAFPPSEQKNPPLNVLATVVSIDGSIREPIPLKHQKTNLYTGTIKLDLTRITESARVCVYAIRAKNGSANGFARRKGSRLAWAAENEIRFAERTKPGNFLQIVWDDFSNSTVIPPHFEGAMYYVDASADLPVLYLNKLATAPLIKLLETEGHGHPKALPRDLIFGSVATNVWLTLAQVALGAIHDEAVASGSPVNLEVFEGSWKKEMVEILAPSLYPNLDLEDALLDLCTRIEDKKYFADTLLRAQLATQTWLGIRDCYDKFAEKVFEND